MSEWFALRPTVATDAPVPERANERRPPAESEPEVSPAEESPTDESGTHQRVLDRPRRRPGPQVAQARRTA